MREGDKRGEMEGHLYDERMSHRYVVMCTVVFDKSGFWKADTSSLNIYFNSGALSENFLFMFWWRFFFRRVFKTEKLRRHDQ